MGIAEDIVKDAFEYYNEEYYKRLREAYPEHTLRMQENGLKKKNLKSVLV